MELLLTTVADYLVSQSWQVPVVFVVVAVVCWGMRKASAHWRYLLWLIVLAKCLVPGMIGVPLAVLPQKAESQRVRPVTMPPSTPIAMAVAKPKPAEPTKAEPEEMAIDYFEPAVAPIAPPQRKTAASSGVHTTEARSIELTPRGWLAIAWATGVGLFLAYLSLRAWTMHRRLRRSRLIADAEVQMLVAALSKRLDLKIMPTVYMADGIAQPFVWGWLRGNIYLPMQFRDSATREQQEAILTHELAHCARCDAAVNIAQIAVQAVFFFHPLIWWANRQIRREREKCCDEFVLASSVADPKQYSQAIVNALVAEYEANRPIPSLAVAGRLKYIEDRIQTILNPKRRFYRRPSWAAVTTVACLTVCAISTVLVLTARGGSADAPRETPQTKPAVDAAGEKAQESKSTVAEANAWQPGQVLDFQVINAKTKEPLPDVKLLIMFSANGADIEENKVQQTDAQGKAEIRLPNRRPDAVRVYPSKEGFVPLRVYWGDDLPSPKLPKSITVPLEPGTPWGGVVKNEKGEPIPDVMVCVHYWSKGKEFNPHLRVNICVEDSVVTTDKDGRWQLDIMPEKYNDDANDLGPLLFLTHPDYVSDHLQRSCVPMPVMKRPSYESLRAQTAMMVLRKGTTIAGRVTDEAGKPISDAMICNQYDAYGPDHLKITATTDNEGNFRLPGLSHRQNYRDYFFTVQAAGYSPIFIEVKDDDAGTPVEIKLKPGQVVQGQVVDENGKPLEGVSIKLDYWMGRPRQFHLKTMTDAEGKFRIDDAPEKNTEYDFEKPGYISVRKPLMFTGKDYWIAMRPPIRITGSIVDAETNKPLTKCMLTKGWDPDNRAPEWETEIGFPATVITDGRYEITIDREQWLTRIRVEADGYMPAVSRLFKPYDPDQGIVTYDFKMTKAGPMTGTVLDVDGKPLADAEVFLAKQQFYAKDHKASPKMPRGSRMVKTDANGRFELPPEVEPFYLIALHDEGHMVLDEKQFAATPTFRIGPWTTRNQSILLQRKQINFSGNAPEDEPQTLNVRIVDAEGKPVEGANVASSAEFRAGYNYLGDNEPAWNYFRNVITDEDGRACVADQYRIDSVVARDVERKLIAIQKISPEQVKSSETVTITLQPQCKVFGILTAKELEAHGRKLVWSNVYAYLPDGIARPMMCNSNKADFHFYLPPGTYKLDAYATDTQSTQKTITVEPGQVELEVEPIDLPPTGLVLLEGKPAPELRDIAAWKNSEPIKLSDLKGKVVILAFSYRWIDPHSIMQELFPVYEKYKDQDLVIIDIRSGMNMGADSESKLAEKIAEIKKPFWKNRDLPIPIALVFENRAQPRQNAEGKNAKPKAPCPILEDYGIYSMPTSVLIDRQGIVVGKYDPRRKSDDAILEKVLNKK